MLTATKDPENHEVEYIWRYAPLEGSRVLDIGCGDGELTFRYAGWSASVMAVDPDLTRLQPALTLHSEEPSKSVHFAAARAEALPFPNEHFDLAIFTSSF
jgi:ubiquinone/menaquinone biosynthesis C-methylase UbiE